MRLHARHLQEVCVTECSDEGPDQAPEAMETVMIDRRTDRPYSDDPYSDIPCDGARDLRASRPPKGAGGPLCAEAQADGVPCYELGRDCETCEQAYLSWADARASDN